MIDGNAASYLRHGIRDNPGHASATSSIRCPGCGQHIAVSRDDDHPEPYSECGGVDEGICSEYVYAMDRDMDEWELLFIPFNPQPPPSDALCAAMENAHTSARIVFALERAAAAEADAALNLTN